MRTLSKQRLQKMHAMLDKELEREDGGLSNGLNVQDKQRQKGDFSHLRYTGNISLESQSIELQNSKSESVQKPSLFRRSLQKQYKQKQNVFQVIKKGYCNLSSQQEQQQVEQKQLKGSLKGSRKNEINQLQKKLLDLQKKMQNIGVSSSDDDEENERLQQQQQQQPNNKDIRDNNVRSNILSKQQSKKSIKTLMLRENSSQLNKQKQTVESNRYEGTARFSGVNNKIEQLNKRQKLDLKSNIPLSHRNNTESSDEEYSTRYQKFVKVSKKGSQKVLEKRELKQRKKEQSSQEEDSSDYIQLNNLRNKSITEQIQRLSIMKKDVPPVVAVNQSKYSKDNTNNISNKPPHKNNIIKQKQSKTKISTLQNLPDKKKQPTIVDHQILQPKYSIEKRNRSKSQSKKTVSVMKVSLSKEEKVIQIKKQKSLSKQRSGSSMRKIPVNLDSSFRSDKSSKSKKSINSHRSIVSNNSNKSHTSNNNYPINNIKQLQRVQQKKYIKKISNLQKQLQHYKRLSKKYQAELSTYKLMQMQYRKLQIQFKKSEQIRVQQKKIIENFRNKMINNV